MRCTGKKGVVTGTSRGLGREILLALCGEGASVVGFARDAEAGGGAVEEAEQAEKFDFGAVAKALSKGDHQAARVFAFCFGDVDVGHGTHTT